MQQRNAAKERNERAFRSVRKMSTKTSPLNALSAAVATTTTATAAAISAATNSSAMNAVKIKKEMPSDEIKEFAESTMNELLGWYGFDDMDRLDLSAKTSRLLQSAAAAENASSSLRQHAMEKRRSRGRATTLLQLQQQTEYLRKLSNNNNNNNNNNNSSAHNHNRNSVLSCNSYRGSVGGVGVGNDSTTSDHDTRSSREDDSKSPHSAGKTTVEEKIDFNNCCWCRRPVPENAPEFLTITDGPRYCSESCFTQSRRASFKKAKTCDWCKHVRHAVSYVDFQDGASQLQFCSDKCLNQYKMQIFCKETQAHLDMNPHLRDQGLEAVAAGNGAGLITPDLWLRNCRSRSASPASTVSVSPGPTANACLSPPRISSNCGGQAGCNTATTACSSAAALQSHKPMISVAPVSKLMSKSLSIMQNRHSSKHSRKKRPLRACVQSSANMSTSLTLKSNHSEGAALSGSGAVGVLSKPRSLLSASANNNLRTSPGAHASALKSGAATLSQFAGSSVQDLHMTVPPLSPMLEQQQPPAPSHSHVLAQAAGVGGRGASMPPAFFVTPPVAQPPQANAQKPTPSSFPPRPPAAFFPPNAVAAGLLPRFAGDFAGFRHMPPMPQPDMAGLAALLGAPPPVTVMVPYPIIIPLPIPIPVPLPVMDFYKAHLSPAERKHFTLQRERRAEEQEKQRSSESDAALMTVVERSAHATDELPEPLVEEPLDFTKAREVAHTSSSVQESEDDIKTENAAANTTACREPIEEALHFESERQVSRPTEDRTSPAAGKVMHCIVPAEQAETAQNSGTAGAGAAAGDGPDAVGEGATRESDDAQQKLPKFKITRLQTKRTLIQAKESECSRPLRKRKRIIDCDFQKITLKDAETEASNDAAATGTNAATERTAE